MIFHRRARSIYYFKRFCRDGTWRRIQDALHCRKRRLEGREEQPSFAIIDSQSVKTGPDACFDIGYDAGKKIRGRKRHILVDTVGMLPKAEIHAARIQDRDGVALVFDKLANRWQFVKKICGDSGQSGYRASLLVMSLINALPAFSNRL
ncbi:transposase [Rhizobium ruizarguesonis]